MRAEISGVTDCLPEQAHRLRHAEGQRVGNDGMADGYFGKVRQGRHKGRQVFPCQVMARIEAKPGKFR